MTVLLFAILAVELVVVALDRVGDVGERERTTPRYDPPVWSGQSVPGACTGGFYARRDRTILLTIAAHCGEPGRVLEDGAGPIGVIGPRATLADCPPGRFCAPSDIMTLELAPARIPWGHLHTIDMGAGGYRMLTAGTRPLRCEEIRVGARVEIDGRERYRSGRVIERGRYEFETDTIFPCIALADIPVRIGDSGGPVLVDGAPAGVTSRSIEGLLGFTPLAEGLESLGLTLCTTPNCDLSPAAAVQPRL